MNPGRFHEHACLKLLYIDVIRIKWKIQDGRSQFNCLECQLFIGMIPTLLEIQSLNKYDHIQCIQIPPSRLTNFIKMVFHVPRLVLY